MKKLFFLLSFLIGGMTLHAQIMDLNDVDWEVYGILHDQPLITSVDQLLSPYSDEQEGLHIEYLLDGDINTFWHSDWHGRVEGTPYIEVVMPEPIEGYVAITFGRRNSGSCHPTRLELQTSADNETWTSAGACDFEYKAVREYVISTPFYVPAGTTRMRVYTVNRTNTVGNLNDIGVGTYHMAEFQMYAMDNGFGNEYTLSKLLEKYDAYLAGEITFDMGSGPGQYSDVDAEQTFLGGLAQASELLASGEFATWTSAQVFALIETIDASLDAIYASVVPYSIPADGYYRIHCAKEYIEEVDNGAIDLDGNPVLDQKVVDKALYINFENQVCWGTTEDDARFIWKLEQNGQGVRMYNAGMGEYPTRLENSRVVTAAEVDTLMMLDYMGNDNGHDLFNIRFSGDNPQVDANRFFHQLNHKQGKGTGSPLCNWKSTWSMTNGDKGTSEFWLEPIDEAEAEALIAEFEVVKNHDKLVLRYTEYIEKAANVLSVAKQGVTLLDETTMLIESASQFSSLWSDPDEGKSFGNLLDGNASTFWHSTWHGSSWNYPTHSFEVSLTEPYTGTLQAYILRRSTNDDHITRMDVYATNDASLLDMPESDGWTLIAKDMLTPWDSSQGEIKTPEFTLNEPYQYLRFYVTNTAGNSYDYRTFFHMAGFKLYPVLKAGHTQYEYFAEEADRLDAIVQAFAAMNTDDLTLNHYNALVEAYEAFAPKIISPSSVQTAINQYRNAADNMMIGTQPGYWTSMAAADNLAQVVKGAVEYVDMAKYTEEDNDAWVARLAEAAAQVNRAAISVNPTKWYRIRFGSQEEYEERGWGTGPAHNDKYSLFDKVVAPGDFVNATDDELGYVQILPHEDIRVGASMKYVNPDELAAEDYCVWRFVPIEEGRWAMQHKYTGMYLQRDRYHGESVHMDIQPTSFEVKPLGLGHVAFVMTDLAGFTWERNYLNGWRDLQALQTWTPETMGGNSGFFIEEVGDIDEDDISSFFYYDVKPGNIYGMCYPVPMTIGGGMMYTVAGTFVENDAQFIALSQIEEAAAGIPFIYIADGEYSDEADTTPVEMRLGSEVVKEPATVNGLKAHFTPMFLDPGFVLFANGKASAQNGNNVSVVSNEAYLSFGASPLEEDAEYDLAIQIDGIAADGIQPVLNKLAKAGDAYDLSGRLVQKNATLNTLKSLKPGIYVLGGVKVMVK